MLDPFDLLKQQHGNEHSDRHEGYALLANVGSVAVEREVVPGAVIRRGTSEEIAVIRLVLRQHVYTSSHLRPPHETKLERREVAPGQVHSTWEPLPPEQWRYTVLRFTGTNAVPFALATASLLTSKQLEVGVDVTLGTMRSISPGFSLRFIETAMQDDGAFLHLDEADLADLADVHARFARHDESVYPLRRIVSDFGELRALPRHSHWPFLGYFALLETMLTHQPRQSDPYESLTRQVRTKMTLLTRRFRTPLAFDDFGDTPPETVWSKLYALRSRIAHGAQPDFTSGELRLLGDMTKATRFVWGATWRVMRQALDEPALLADLKNC